jgi:sulfide:quinone oxidoreductase
MIHHQVVIVGGGEAGLAVAARLLANCPGVDVAIIEPCGHHDFKRMWMLVGGGLLKPGELRRDKATLIPEGAHWIREAVASFAPDCCSLTTCDGVTITYKFLVVAPGIQLNWHHIPGLRESIGQGGVCSVYSPDTVASTWEFIRTLSEGVALFTQPSGPIKCPYGSQEICYLAEEHFRTVGVRDKTHVILASGADDLFPLREYREVLENVAAERGVETRMGIELVEVRPSTKEAIFRDTRSGAESVIRYDVMHVAPPMSALDFVAQSPLAGEGGWVDVDQHTLQHRRFPNVFGIGDASSLPTPKMGATIRHQVPVLVGNLLAGLEGRPVSARYDGYTTCPILTGYESLLIAEFDYRGLTAGDAPTRLLNLAPSCGEP